MRNSNFGNNFFLISACLLQFSWLKKPETGSKRRKVVVFYSLLFTSLEKLFYFLSCIVFTAALLDFVIFLRFSKMSFQIDYAMSNRGNRSSINSVVFQLVPFLSKNYTDVIDPRLDLHHNYIIILLGLTFTDILDNVFVIIIKWMNVHDLKNTFTLIVFLKKVQLLLLYTLWTPASDEFYCCVCKIWTLISVWYWILILLLLISSFWLQK